ncbi:MAG: class I SAM-dependent methyltransferase [Nitratireductor sp.]
MYRLAHALIASHGEKAPQVLIVGAGGGREIAEFRNSDAIGGITAIDPSPRNLEMARTVAGASGASPEVNFIVGTADDLPGGVTFDVVTSLLVMHHLPDDGTKQEYLRGLCRRLAPGGRLIHADVCFDESAKFYNQIPAFLAHAEILGVSAAAARLELEAIPTLPVVSGDRTRTLFAEAGLTEPQEVFRTLWYRCWVSTDRQT